ncbi:MAG TPA: hypothetical protein PKJ99_02410 [Thermoanaerobaculales bacterium]|mgnify:FL=1|nr:hypothetical protein [Thermoanaerobaculales bacterium]
MFDFLTIEEARQQLRDSSGEPLFAKAQFYRLVRAGVVPSLRVGRRVFVPVSKWVEWLDSGGAGLAGGWRSAPSE